MSIYKVSNYQQLTSDTIPKTTTYLSFDYNFNQPLVPGIIPPSVTNITFNGCFNQQIEPGVIPPSVTHLDFGNSFNQLLAPGAIPPSVTHVQFDEGFKQPLIEGVIPSSVKRLRFCWNFNQPIVVPPTTTIMARPDDYVNYMQNNCHRIEIWTLTICFPPELTNNYIVHNDNFYQIKTRIYGAYYKISLRLNNRTVKSAAKV